MNTRQPCLCRKATQIERTEIAQKPRHARKSQAGRRAVDAHVGEKEHAGDDG